MFKKYVYLIQNLCNKECYVISLDNKLKNDVKQIAMGHTNNFNILDYVEVPNKYKYYFAKGNGSFVLVKDVKISGLEIKDISDFEIFITQKWVLGKPIEVYKIEDEDLNNNNWSYKLIVGKK